MAYDDSSEFRRRGPGARGGDTNTTGASPLTAVRAVRKTGEVVSVATVVDRRATGAAEVIEAEGVLYRSRATRDLGLVAMAERDPHRPRRPRLGRR